MRIGVSTTIALLAALAGACSGGYPVVETGSLERRDVVETLEAPGEVGPFAVAGVGTSRMARVAEILVAEGEAVRKGQRLVRLEAIQPAADLPALELEAARLATEAGAVDSALRTLSATQKAQQAALEAAEAALVEAARLFDRAQRLNEGGLISRTDFERAREQAAAAETLVREQQQESNRGNARRETLLARQTEARQRIAEAERRRREALQPPAAVHAVSPIAGVVVELPAQVGRIVAPGLDNTSASLGITVANLADATIVANPSGAVRSRFTPGLEVEAVFESLPPRALQARVAASNGGGGESAVTAVLKNPPNWLRPQMRCTVRLRRIARKDALFAPSRAIVRRGVGGELSDGVFVIESGVAVFRAVGLGIEEAESTEITSGLTARDSIVVGPAEALRSLQSGERIRQSVQNEN